MTAQVKHNGEVEADGHGSTDPSTVSQKKDDKPGTQQQFDPITSPKSEPAPTRHDGTPPKT